MGLLRQVQRMAVITGGNSFLINLLNDDFETFNIFFLFHGLVCSILTNLSDVPFKKPFYKDYLLGTNIHNPPFPHKTPFFSPLGSDSHLGR